VLEPSAISGDPALLSGSQRAEPEIPSKGSQILLTLHIGENPLPREFAQQSILIGRASSCDVVLGDRRASRQHARIEKNGDQVQVVDLDSGNGTILNGRKVQSGILMTGDRIQFGRTLITVIRLRVPEPSESGPEASGEVPLEIARNSSEGATGAGTSQRIALPSTRRREATA